MGIVGRVWPRHGHRGRPLNLIVRRRGNINANGGNNDEEHGTCGIDRCRSREWFDFCTFSHAKATFLQSRYTLSSLLMPPYGRAFRCAIAIAIRRNS